MKVPPLDLKREFKEFGKVAQARVSKILAGGHYILGEEVKGFESQFAQFNHAKHAIGVASGSDALLLSLMALGVERGDEVITTAFTFIATASAIVRLGAKPVFVDIDPVTFNINPDLIESKITSKTKAIIPVHIYGQPCDMTKIMQIAKKHKLKVLEDCAQACGAEWKGKTVGSFGDFGAFSFYPTKTIGAFGDGGAVVTNDSNLDFLIRSIRNYGMDKKRYYHERLGVNSRLDEIQAAILNIKLKRLTRWNNQRRKVAKIYDDLLKKTGLEEIQIPKRFSENKHVFHQYGILVKKRDELLSSLQSNGIAAGVYYPLPLHLQNCFKSLGYHRDDLPETERITDQVINLPIFPQITSAEQKFTVKKIQEFYS